MSDAPSTRASGRLARGPFVLAAVVVYLLSFLSQTLLSAPVTAPLGVAAFALAQAALIAIWIVLHRRRLRDAGRPDGIVIGIAAVYVLEVVLLTILVWLMLPSGAGAAGVGPGAPIVNVFVILYLLTLLGGDPSLGALQVWVLGIILVMLLPIAIALGFSLWTATRPTVSPSP